MEELNIGKLTNDKQNVSSEEVNILPLFLTVLRKFWLIILVAVITGAAFFGVTKSFITPTYRSSFTAYVNNKSQFNNIQDTLTIGDITAAEQLVQAYSKAIQSRTVLSDAASSIGLTDDFSDIESRVSTVVENETFIITVYVIDTSPNGAYNLAKSIANTAPNKVADIFEGSSMKIIDSPQIPTTIYKPSYIKNTAIGFLLGAFAAVGFIIIRFLTDDKVKNESDLESRFSIPVVGVIPDMLSSSKNGHNYYDYEYAYRNSEIKRSGGKNGKDGKK